MATFSIIIPHKNIPELLQRCLASIPERDDIQVIIVDDNSDEDIVDFQNFPGLNRHNTEVYFDKTGKGAGRARNVGLEHAKGEWVLFADADDVFTSEISNILDSIKNRAEDLVFFDVISRDSETNIQNNESKFYNDILQNCIINGTERFKLNFETPWGKAIKRTYIKNNHIQFEETYCGNDTRFSVLCSYYTKKIHIINIVGYCWMHRSDSLWHDVNIKWYECRFRVYARLVNFMKKEGVDIQQKKYEQNCKYYLSSIRMHSEYNYLTNLIYYIYQTGEIRLTKNVFISLYKLAIINLGAFKRKLL